MADVIIPFSPSSSANFQFQATLDGADYNCVCRWNFYAQRYYLFIYDLAQNLVLVRPVVGSPDTANISLTAGFFDTTIVYRDSRAVFEIPGQPPTVLVTRPPSPPAPPPPPPPPANYAQEVGSDNPIIWWRMNDAPGSTTGADSGSLGLPFTLTGENDSFGGVALWQQGASLVCGGTDYNAAIAPYNPAVNFQGAGLTFTTLVIWNGYTQNCNITGHGKTNLDWSNWDFFITPAGYLVLRLGYANSAVAQVEFTSTTTVPVGAVFRAAARWNSATGEVGLWINGDRVATGTFSHSLWLATSPVGVGTFPFTAGSDPGNGQFQGNIAELALYDYPLTDARIAAQYNALA